MTTNANAFAGNPPVIGLKAARPVALRPRLLPGLPSGEDGVNSMQAAAATCRLAPTSACGDSPEALFHRRDRSSRQDQEQFNVSGHILRSRSRAADPNVRFIERLAAVATCVTHGEICEWTRIFASRLRSKARTRSSSTTGITTEGGMR